MLKLTDKSEESRIDFYNFFQKDSIFEMDYSDFLKKYSNFKLSYEGFLLRLEKLRKKNKGDFELKHKSEFQRSMYKLTDKTNDYIIISLTSACKRKVCLVTQPVELSKVLQNYNPKTNIILSKII